MPVAADLFCGAGGTSTGLLMAAQEMGEVIQLLAVNHWDIAISTHSANHPLVTHYNSDLADIDPRLVIPDGQLRLLVASPECTHFSRARGGKPKSNQSRASVKYVLRWIAALDVENVLVENVPEFMDWGPLHRTHSGKCDGEHENHISYGDDGFPIIDEEYRKIIAACHYLKPIRSRRGEYFRRFISKVRQSGYSVEWRVLNAANYGDATTRKRLFIMARKGNEIQWPKPSHSRTGRDMTGDYLPWRPARDVIDWSVKGESIYTRKKPLSPNTLRRIEAGLRKYSGLPFVIGQQSGAAPRTTEAPLPTIASAGAISLVQPFLVQYHGSSYEGGERVASVDKPLPTVATANQYALVEPFLITTNWPETNRSRPRSIDEPVPTIMGHPTVGLVEPFIIQMDMRARLQSVDEPFNTITSADARALVQPFIVPVNHGNEPRTNSIDAPLPTITGFDALGLAQPFLVMLNGTQKDKLESSSKSIDEPVPTIVGSNHAGLVEPYLVKYHGTGGAVPVDMPLPTQTGKDRFGLVEPVIFRDEAGNVFMLDIRFRMLQPRELARAMSFPDDYQFQGNREQVVKQIGNAVPVQLAKALCKSLLS